MKTRIATREVGNGNMALRNRLQKSGRWESIIDLTHPTGGVKQQRGRFVSQYGEIGNSGIEIEDNAAQRSENGLCETVGGPHLDKGV